MEVVASAKRLNRTAGFKEYKSSHFPRCLSYILSFSSTVFPFGSHKFNTMPIATSPPSSSASMSSAWACYVDNNGQPQYLVDSAGNYVQYNEVVQSASASKSDSGKSDTSDSSISSKNSKGSRHSHSSKSSKASKHSKASDSGQSSNTPATVGWVCNWCQTTNYTDHQNIPFMDPIRDNNENIVHDQSGNPSYDDYPHIPCSGCNGNCTPYCSPIVDP